MERPRISFWLFWICLSLLVILAGCGDDDDDSSGSPPDTDDDDSADDDSATDDDTSADDDFVDDDDDDTGFIEPFDPLTRGPYEVGNRTFIFVDDTRWDMPSKGYRTLLTEVWYPAGEMAAKMPRDTVTNFIVPWQDFIETVLSYLIPPEEMENFTAERDSARNAPINEEGGPYPLILISHGNASIRFASMTLAEYLASHGYIVVAPDHIGNSVFVTLPDRLVIYNPLVMPFSAVDRVIDMWFLADKFTQLNEDDPSGFFTNLVDVEKLGIVGHSFGGVTGAEWGILDDRVKAAVDMAAFYIPIYPETYDTALMIMVGGEDRTMGDWTPFTHLFWQIWTPGPKYWINVHDGGHYTFTDACFLIPTLMGNGDGCGEGTREATGEPFDYLDMDTSFALVNSYITAFFGYHLKGQDSMWDALSTNRYPDAMDLQVGLPE